MKLRRTDFWMRPNLPYHMRERFTFPVRRRPPWKESWGSEEAEGSRRRRRRRNEMEIGEEDAIVKSSFPLVSYLHFVYVWYNVVVWIRVPNKGKSRYTTKGSYFGGWFLGKSQRSGHGSLEILEVRFVRSPFRGEWRWLLTVNEDFSIIIFDLFMTYDHYSGLIISWFLTNKTSNKVWKKYMLTKWYCIVKS